MVKRSVIRPLISRLSIKQCALIMQIELQYTIMYYMAAGFCPLLFIVPTNPSIPEHYFRVQQGMNTDACDIDKGLDAMELFKQRHFAISMSP
jgi:hypothetical protein